jgi:hypothetical protein
VRLTDTATDLENGYLSIASLLGKSVYGAKEGAEIEFQLDDGRQRKALIESVEKTMRPGADAPLPETADVPDQVQAGA